MVLKQLGNEFVKNLKIMFRNWTSLSLLVIAPLIFILLVGYAFSSEDITGINLGLIAEDNVDISQLTENVSSFATIHRYNTVEVCQADMILERVHICIGLESEDEDNIPDKVVYYYDNSRKFVSLQIIDKIQGFFGLKAEEISIERAEGIIENIQKLIGFIDERRLDIEEAKNESIGIKLKLIERKAKLEELRRDFLPSYFLIKDLQQELHNKSIGLNDSKNSLLDTTERISIMVDEIRESSNEPFLLLLFDELDNELNVLDDQVNSTISDINSIVDIVDEVVVNVNDVKDVLDEEIELTDRMIKDIDKSLVKIDEATNELDEKLGQLKKLETGEAEKLIRPILYDYNVVLEDKENIQLTFPSLLAFVIMFISLLFSNISTLTEIHNKAYLRNIIAPVNDLIYVFGMLITGTIIVFLQIIVLFAVAQTKFGIRISEFFWEVGLVSVLLILFFILIGMIFAYLFDSMQTSVLVTTFSALVFFMFSSFFTSIETMPAFARFLSVNNPLVIGEFLFRQIQLFRTSLWVLSSGIWLLVVYVLILLIILFGLAKYKNSVRK